MVLLKIMPLLSVNKNGGLSEWPKEATYAQSTCENVWKDINLTQKNNGVFNLEPFYKLFLLHFCYSIHTTISTENFQF